MPGPPPAPAAGRASRSRAAGAGRRRSSARAWSTRRSSPRRRSSGRRAGWRSPASRSARAGRSAASRGARPGRREPRRSRRSRPRHPRGGREGCSAPGRPTGATGRGTAATSPFGRRGKRQPRDRQQLVAALGHESRLEALGRAEHEHLGVRFALDEPVGGGEQRIDVAGGASAGEQVSGHRRALPELARASGRCLRERQHHPDRRQGRDQGRASRRDQGQRHPEHRQQPEHHRDVHEGLADDPDHGRAGRELGEGVARHPDDAHEADRQQDEQAEHQDRADQAELFADDREDEVVVGLGNPRPFAGRVAEPDPEDAAVGERLPAVRDLVAIGLREIGVRAAAEPGRDAAGARGADLHEDQRDRGDHRDRAGDPAQLDTREEQRAERDRDQDDRGAQVAAEQHETDRQPDDGADGEQDALPVIAGSAGGSSASRPARPRRRA